MPNIDEKIPLSAIEIHKWGIEPSDEVEEVIACFHGFTYKYPSGSPETGEQKVRRLLAMNNHQILWTGIAVDYRYGEQIHDCLTVIVKIKKAK